MKRVIFISLIVFLVSLKSAAQPTPIYPLGAINTLTPLFQWSVVPSATSYHLQVYAGPSVVIDQIVVENVYQTPTGVLSVNTQYYWRVASVSLSGTVWSGNMNFNISLLPDPPVLLLPADGALLCSSSILFDWTDVTGALSYRIQVSADSNFSYTVLDVSGLTNSGYTLTASIINYNTLYYWRVMAYYSGGNTNWSVKRRFIVGSVPAPPVYITCPVGIIHTLTPAFIWSPSPGIIAYRVMFSTSPAFSLMLYDTTVY
ncbi:MAG: hypothetical protein LWX07_12795, partial [Bacteroidetes bacterium]|nr:hypothetical protein [Bacteroidota bacterium]